MIKGTVKWFNNERGFGFVVADSKEYFVHFKEIKTNGFKTLNEGEAVTFEPATTHKGNVAKNVVRENIL